MENNEISVISKSVFLGKEIDVYGTPEEPLFKAKDVAGWLDIQNVSDMIKNIDQEEKVLDSIYTLGGTQEAWLLTEDGLYEVLMQSRKPIAKQFKKGVKDILKTIRKTGGYVVSESPMEQQIKAKMMFADWSAKFLNLNEASKLGIAQRIGREVGLEDALPKAINAGTEKPTLHAAKDLLKEFNVGISSIAFNKILISKGIVKTASRPSKDGKTHTWKVLQSAYNKYGQNIQDPKYQSQTQIKWYDNLFMEFLGVVGIANEKTLGL